VSVDADILLESQAENLFKKPLKVFFFQRVKDLKLSKISCNLSPSLTLLALQTKKSRKLSNAPENKLSSRLYPFRLVDSLLQACHQVNLFLFQVPSHEK
jgi:hypothetical protein